MPPYQVKFHGRYEASHGPYRSFRIADGIARQIYGKLDSFIRSYTGWKIEDLNPHPPGKRIAVVSSRGFKNWLAREKIIRTISETLEVNCWLCSSTDTARDVIEQLNQPIQYVSMDFELHGRYAPISRNTAMIDEEPNLVLLFGGGDVVDNMERQCRSLGIQVRKTW